MRLNWLVSGPTLKSLLVVLAAGGFVAASCTFNPGPAGSSVGSTGTGYGGNGILGQANHTGTTGQSTGLAGSTRSDGHGRREREAILRRTARTAARPRSACRTSRPISSSSSTSRARWPTTSTT